MKSWSSTLAVGGIIGGYTFDTSFFAASDIAYREGSVYYAISTDTDFWLVLTLLISAFLIMGLIRRERQAPGGIGVESAAVMLLYLFAVFVLLAV